MRSVSLLFIVIFFITNSIAQNKNEIDSLKLIVNNSVVDSIRLNNLNKLSELYQRTNPTSSIIYAEQALLIAKEKLSQKGILTSYKNIATAYYFRSSYNLAIDYFLRALKIAKDQQAPKDILDLYNDIGVTYKNMGFYFKALEYYYKSLKIAEEQDDKFAISNSLNNIAIIYKKQASYDKAMEYYKKSLKIAKEINDKEGVLITYNNIGVLYRNIGDFKKSTACYLKSLSIAKELGNKKDISDCYTNIGTVYKEMHSYDIAMEYYRKAVKIKIKLEDKKGIAVLYNNIALLNLNIKDSAVVNNKQKRLLVNNAIEYGEKAFVIAKDIKSLPQILSSSKILMKAYKEKGNYKKAIEFSEIFISTKDSVFNNEKSKAITEIEIKYETERKEAENIALKKEAIFQKKKNKRQTFLIVLSVIISILFLIMILIILSGRNKHRKTNKLLIKNNKLLNEKNNELLAADEELKQNNEDLLSLYDNANIQKEIIEIKNQELKDIVAHFRLAQEAGKIGTWEWDVVTGNLIWSKTTYEIFGIQKTNKAIKNKDYLDRIFPDDKQKIVDDLKIALKNKETSHKSEYRIVRDNNIVWVKESSKLFINDNGKLIKTIGVIQDITLQKQYNQTLKESEEKFRAITSSANDAIVLINNEGNVAFWNKAAENTFGYKESEIMGKNIIKYLIPKEYGEIDYKAFLSFKNTGKNSVINNTVELLVVKKSGKIFPVEISSSAIKINGLWNAVAIIKDITKRKQTEILIKDKNEQQKVLINNIPVHIYFKDTNLKYVLANNSYAKLFNLSVDEIIGKTDSEFADFETYNFYEELDKQVIRTKKPIIDLKKVHTDLDGKKYWALTSKMPHFNLNGDVKGVIGIVKDITEQMQYEQDLKLQKETLEIAHKDITDSIYYAQTIQEALLPSKKTIDLYFNEIFILFKPKEAVSGDFYFLTKKENHLIFAVADCTGHGVPGGFLTMLGITYINDIVKRKETYTVGGVLNILRDRMKSTFNTLSSRNSNGLDIALCAIDTKTNILQYSGAYNPLWIIRNNELLEFKATRNPIGYYFIEKEFENNIIQLQDNDLIYIFSDGYQDQIGGEMNKKFLVKRFRELILRNHSLPLKEQNEILNKTITEWQGKNAQVDDITVMGIKWKNS